MRRIALLAVALVSLIAAATAYAVVTNSYTATTKISPSKPGSAANPSPVTATLNYTAKGNNGARTGAISDIKNTWFGLVSDGKDFPVCTAGTINNALSDSGCPKGSEVGIGSLTAVVGPSAEPLISQSAGAPCSKAVHVYNAGQGKLTFFLVGPGASCANVAFLQAFPGTVKTSGGTLTIDAPIPPSITAPLQGLEGSLTGEKLTYHLVKGKHSFLSSVGCKGGKRAYSNSFSSGGKTVTLKGSLAC
jgi:hypothetical protein